MKHKKKTKGGPGPNPRKEASLSTTQNESPTKKHTQKKVQQDIRGEGGGEGKITKQADGLLFSTLSTSSTFYLASRAPDIFLAFKTDGIFHKSFLTRIAFALYVCGAFCQL